MSLKNKKCFMQTLTDEQKREEEAYKNVKILSIDKKDVIGCITCRQNSFAVTKEKIVDFFSSFREKAFAECRQETKCTSDE